MVCSRKTDYGSIAQICDHMLALGWGPYQNDHEDANGQFEMNWTFSDALTTADRHSFFKYMVKSLAETHGLRATFMPKPFANLSGNGCHVHVSLWDEAERNAFFTGNNRTHMIRIPDVDRFELRLPDGSANPYLLQGTVIAAGLDGLTRHRDPGRRCDNNIYTEPAAAGDVRRLPTNLLDALRALRANADMVSALGSPFVDAYVKLKELEWHEHHAQISPWERAATLDC